MKHKKILAAGLIVTMLCPVANIAMANEEAVFSSAVENSSAYTESVETDFSVSDESTVLPDIESEHPTDSGVIPDDIITNTDENLSSEGMDFDNNESISMEDSEASVDTGHDEAIDEEAAVQDPEDSSTESESGSNSAKEALETPVQYEIGQLVKLPDGSNFYREGYIFVGWNTDPDATEGFFELVIQEDTHLYAIWIPETDRLPSVSRTEDDIADDSSSDEATAEDGITDDDSSDDATAEDGITDDGSSDEATVEESITDDDSSDEATEKERVDDSVVEDVTETEEPASPAEPLESVNPAEPVKSDEADLSGEDEDA